jgi:signal peptide peptidase SppA
MIDYILGIHPQGAEAFCKEEITGSTEKAFISSARVGGSIAVLPMMGGIRHRGGFMGTSIESFRERFRAAIANPEVKAVVFNVDSPGGTVSGVPEMAEEIFEARSQKPIIAVANTMAASAAYWLASAASRVVVTPSGSVGSIGVFAMHIDQSKMLDDFGLKVTLISAGKYKVEGNSFQHITEEAYAQIQKEVNDVYGDFISDVAKFRGTDIERVLNDFGQGRMVRAKDAVKLNMADSIDTVENVINNLVTVQQSRTRASAKLKLAIL